MKLWVPLSRGPSAHGLDPWGKPGPMLSPVVLAGRWARLSPGIRLDGLPSGAGLFRLSEMCFPCRFPASRSIT
jgi:hypothetical protein